MENESITLTTAEGKSVTATPKQFKAALAKLKNDKAKPIPAGIDPGLAQSIFSAYDRYIMAVVECNAAKEEHKEKKEAEEVAQAELNQLIREARFGDEALPFSKGEAGEKG